MPWARFSAFSATANSPPACCVCVMAAGTAGTAPTPAPAAAAAPAPAPRRRAPALKEASPDAALQLLGLLQRDARFIDFVEEDIKNYSDADIGAAARLVHDGCRATLREHFTIRPVRDEAEGSRVTLPEGFDASAVRLTGNVVGKAPFSGSISHRGWRVDEVRLPKLTDSHNAKVDRTGGGGTMSDARYSDRHRPGHDALRAVLRRHQRERRRKDRARRAADRATHRPRRDRQPRSAAVVPLSAASGRTRLRRSASAVDRPARVRGRRVRPQPRRGHADPAGVEREKLAVPSGRGPARSDSAERRAARSRARLAARKLGALSDASARSVGPRASRRAVQRSRTSRSRFPPRSIRPHAN